VQVPALTLVLGGARSGKSRYAEGLVQALPPPWIYVATAQAYDNEMRERISTHRTRRPAGWSTVEAPLGLVAAIREAPEGAPVLVDCLTLWLTNVLLSERDVASEIDDLMQACRRAPGPLILVSNEVGLSIVPDNALSRRFRDEAGLLHQRIAEIADRVVLMVAGLPLVAKREGRR
jgi:adenosylcobinamide kinase/adenosylcobinamide-phosphate guanylyltransferase